MTSPKARSWLQSHRLQLVPASRGEKVKCIVVFIPGHPKPPMLLTRVYGNYGMGHQHLSGLGQTSSIRKLS